MPEFTTVPLLRACSWLSGAALVALVATMLAFGLAPELAARHYFHPAHDPVWAGLLAQLVHYDTAHLLLNLVGLSGLCLLARLTDKLAAIPVILVMSALVVSIGLRLETSPLAWYVGLSGALYGVWAWLALELTWQAGTRLTALLAGLVCIAIGVKAALGLGAGLLPGNMPIAHSAHLYGYAGGIGCAACSAVQRYCGRRLPRRTE